MFNPNHREQRILKRIQGIKKPTKVIVRKPKKGLSKDESKMKAETPNKKNFSNTVRSLCIISKD